MAFPLRHTEGHDRGNDEFHPGASAHRMYLDQPLVTFPVGDAHTFALIKLSDVEHLDEGQRTR